MRRLLAVLMMLPLLLLAGCGKEEEQTQRALDFRTALLEAGGCAFDADVQISYGDTLAAFSLHCTASLTDGVTMTLTAPETLRGMTARVDAEGAKIVYDGAELGFSTLAGGNLAPMAVPWELTRCWAEGYIAWTGMEGELLRVTYLSGYGDREIQADVWFDGMTPCRAELAYEGQKLVSAGISNFTFEA